MATNESDVKALVEQMPDADKPGETSKFTGPAPGAAEEVFEGILSGGRGSLLELIAMLRDHTDPEFKDFRPEYVLHGLAIYVGRPGNEKQQEQFAKTLASQLDSDEVPSAVKAYLIRELQVVGGEDVVKALGEMLGDEALCEYAAQALVAIGDGAGKRLRGALRKAKGRCRVTIVQNLGVVRDRWSVRALKKVLADEDADVRVAAAWALARIGSPGTVDAVLKAADAEPGWERIKTTQACLVLAENLLAAGKTKDAEEIYARLRDSRTDESEHYVREAAERGLAAADG